MTDLSLIVAIVGSSIAIVGVVIALMLWVRGEANSDRRDIFNLVLSIQNEIHAIQLEMKDFHNRLCAIEERRGK